MVANLEDPGTKKISVCLSTSLHATSTTLFLSVTQTRSMNQFTKTFKRPPHRITEEKKLYYKLDKGKGAYCKSTLRQNENLQVQNQGMHLNISLLEYPVSSAASSQSTRYKILKSQERVN